MAPQAGKTGRGFLDHLKNANNDANPELMRLALKLATGAGKTTVMAMLIAWQTINAVRPPAKCALHTRGFLVVAPGFDHSRQAAGATAKRSRQLLSEPSTCPRGHAPPTLSARKSSLRITTHSSCGTASLFPKAAGHLLQGRGDALSTVETEGQMLQRVMPRLMSMKNILAINDEAHHCYREKPGEGQEGPFEG